MSELANIFGARVRARRIDLGLTQEGFALQLGISRIELSIIENGRANPQLKTIEKMALRMGLEPTELLTPLEN